MVDDDFFVCVVRCWYLCSYVFCVVQRFGRHHSHSCLRSKCTGKKLPFLFFSMILHVFLSRPFQGKNLKKIYGTQKWQKTMGNFRREFREHRKISVDRLCSFGIYYLVSSAWASSIFEKSLYLFIISSLEWSTQQNTENHWKE